MSALQHPKMWESRGEAVQKPQINKPKTAPFPCPMLKNNNPYYTANTHITRPQ